MRLSVQAYHPTYEMFNYNSPPLETARDPNVGPPDKAAASGWVSQESDDDDDDRIVHLHYYHRRCFSLLFYFQLELVGVCVL